MHTPLRHLLCPADRPLRPPGRFWLPAAFLLLAMTLSPAQAQVSAPGDPLHQDIETHTVLGSILPPVFGGTWTVDSRLNILSAEPHTLTNGSTVNFNYREFYNLSADSFTPLIVPGSPNLAPTKPGDDLSAKTWTMDIRNDGCGVFDYTTPWTFNINPNTSTLKNPDFTLGLSKGPVSFSVNFGGGSIPATVFNFVPLPNDLRIEFATSDQGQGFFANGDRCPPQAPSAPQWTTARTPSLRLFRIMRPAKGCW